MSSGATRSSQDRYLFPAIQNFRECCQFSLSGANIGVRIRKTQAWVLLNRFTKRYVSGQGNHGNTALRKGRLYANLQDARHLRGLGDEFTIVAALRKKIVWVGFLEVAASDFIARYLCSNHEHRNAATLTVI